MTNFMDQMKIPPQASREERANIQASALLAVTGEMLAGFRIPYDVQTVHNSKGTLTGLEFTFTSTYCELVFELVGRTDPRENGPFVSVVNALGTLTPEEFEGFCLDCVTKALKEVGGGGSNYQVMEGLFLLLKSIDTGCLPEKLKKELLDYQVCLWLEEHDDYKGTDYVTELDRSTSSFGIEIRRENFCFKGIVDIGDALRLLCGQKFRLEEIIGMTFTLAGQCFAEGIRDPERIRQIWCKHCGYHMRHQPLVGISIQDEPDEAGLFLVQDPFDSPFIHRIPPFAHDLVDWTL